MAYAVFTVISALRAAKNKDSDTHSDGAYKCVYLTPQGRTISQKLFHEVLSLSSLTLLCGRYEGVDERIIESEVDDEWSLGDFVLSGGEVAAAAIIDGVTRLLPGVLGGSESAQTDSFENGLLACPQYTRPEKYEGKQVPKVLLSGDHKKIKHWRLEQSLKRTFERRPDLLEKLQLSGEAYKVLQEIIDSHRAGK